ncbi:MAG: hypothetical protein PVG83_10745, partial [Acidimicrobiia bacterium]
MRRAWIVRSAIFLATVAATWAVLSIGSVSELPDLVPGDVAQEDYFADKFARVVDVDRTEALRQEARDSVPEPLQRDAEVESRVMSNVVAVFDDLTSLVVGERPASEASIPELPEEPEATETTNQAGETSIPPADEPAILTGRLFLDVDGDSLFDPETGDERADIGLEGVTIDLETYDGTDSVVTDSEGSWSYEYAGGPVVVSVAAGDSDIPSGYLVGTDNTGQLVECEAGETCETEDVGFQVNLRDVSEVVGRVTNDHVILEDTIMYLATVAGDDVVRAALGEPLHLPRIQSVARTDATLALSAGIQVDGVEEAQVSVKSNPQLVYQDDTGLDAEGSAAAAEVVASKLEANLLVNEALWVQQQSEEAAQVTPVEVDYQEGEVIARDGDSLTQLDIDAIQATTIPTIDEQPSVGLAALVVVLIALVGLYLARFRPEFWARPRMIALLGIMIVLAAAAVRGTVALHDSFGWYVMPAVAFGFMTAVLFDQRIAILIALSVGVLTAAGTLDVGVTVYASLAALAPIPFVSSLSSRGAFRSAVVYSSLTAAAIAAATSWFFHVGSDQTIMEVVSVSVAWAFGVSALSSLVGLAALQFFESAFDITTTLSLLDLTDR